MLGLMQDHPLLISSLIQFAERHHGEGEIVSRRVEGDLHRYTYKDLAARSQQVANALDGLKLAFGDRVATLAVQAGCCIHLIRACIRSRSPGSPTTRKTRCSVLT